MTPKESEMSAEDLIRQWFYGKFDGTETDLVEAMRQSERAAEARGRREENEVCAKIADEHPRVYANPPGNEISNQYAIASAIRARITQKD